MKSHTSDFFAGRNITLFFICSAALFFATLCFVGIHSPVHAGIYFPVHTDGQMPQIGLQPAYPNLSDPISQAYFIFKSSPGTSIQNAVRVINNGTIPGNVKLYSTDAITGATSGAVYLDQTAHSQDVGKWLTLDRSLLTLYPGKSIVVPFEITLPKKVRSGVHLGGIGMEVTPIGGTSDTVIGKNNAMYVHTRVLTIIAVEMILPGKPIEALTATGVQAGGANNYQDLLLTLHNTGNQLLKPFGSLQVMDAHGAPLQTLPISMDTFLPATSILYPVYLKKALGEGNYQVILTLTYGNHHTLLYKSPFTITPQQILQAFPPSSHPIQAPLMSTSVPLWVILLGSFLGICTILFLIQQCRPLILSMQKKKKRKSGSNKNFS